MVRVVICHVLCMYAGLDDNEKLCSACCMELSHDGLWVQSQLEA